MKNLFSLLRYNFFEKEIISTFRFRYYFLCSSLCLFFLFSCEGILEEDPKIIAAESFYNTPKEVETGLNAIYAPLRNTSDGGIVGINSTLGEFTYGRGSWAPLNNYQGLNDTWITRVSNMWRPFYLGIRNANLIILNVPNGHSLNQSEIDVYVAEAKFLRAFAYFQLVKNWGGVPLRTEANLLVTDLKRSTKNEIYNFIVQDLIQAETNLSDEPRLRGTPSKWVAKTMLADVYLYMEMFKEARDKAKEVIESNKYSLVPVSTSDDFQQIFGPGVSRTSEEIFYTLYSNDPGQGNTWPCLMNHPGTRLYGNSGVFGVHSDSNNSAYSEWDNNDLRKGLWYLWNIGLGPTSLLSKKLIDPQAQGCGGGSNPITWYRYADLLLIYAEASVIADNGPSIEAIEALNQVHRRAYGYNPTTPSPVDFNISGHNTNSFLDIILKERGFEFDLEGKRWSDLKRTGKAEEIILAVKGVAVPEKNYLWPIPINEFNFNLALNPVVDQNPGY